MSKALTNARIDELTLVFKTDPTTGAEFAPRNPLAKILSVKGFFSQKAAGLPAESPFMERVSPAVKAYFDPEWTPGEYPVTEAADDIDNDGDGPSDYNAILGAIAQVYMDTSACYWLSDDAARSIAIKTSIDTFLAELDKFRAGDDTEKAGARHSKADMEKLQKLGDHLKNATDVHASLMPQADKEDAAEDKGDGEGEDDAVKATVVKPLDESPLAVEVKAEDVAKTVLDQVGTMLEAFKADITTHLANHADAVDDKINVVLEPVTTELSEKTEQVSKLSAAVAMLETVSARKATAPGGLPHFNGEGFQSNSFATQDVSGNAVEIPPNMPFSEAMKLLTH